MADKLKKVQQAFASLDIENLMDSNCLVKRGTSVDTVDFLLESAVLSYRYDCFNNQYNEYLSYFPDVRTYYPIMFGKNVSNEDVKNFFRFIRGIKFADYHVDNTTTDKYLLIKMTEKCSISAKVFRRLLYFTIFSLQFNIKNITEECMSHLSTDSISSQIFEVYPLKIDTQYKWLMGFSKIVFHVTNDYYLYSILRNGTQYSTDNISTVTVTTDMNSAIEHTDPNSRVLLILKAELWNDSGNDQFELPHNRLQLKAIVWVKKANFSDMKTIVKSTLKNLCKRQQTIQHKEKYSRFTVGYS